MSAASALRQQIIGRLAGGAFDVVVIGGGITGASIARRAARSGYRVALIEQADFGSGTSSRSSRLIHGGLRYLEHAKLGLVLESLRERERLMRRGRHLVRPLPFLVPVYRGDERGLLTTRFGVGLYGLLAPKLGSRNHHVISTSEMLKRAPQLRAEGLRGGATYYDCQTDDARLVLENVLDAVDAGAVVASYARLERVDTTVMPRKLTISDRLAERDIQLHAQVIVSATGPWTDDFLAKAGAEKQWLRPSKGVHLLLPARRLSPESALLLRHPVDNRVVFVIPSKGGTVVGTTDTDFSGDPAKAQVEPRDASYLLELLTHFFPSKRLTAADVLSEWAGVRPLVADGAASPSAVSREHRIESWPKSALVAVAGGKLTTYEPMARQALAAVETLLDRSRGISARGRKPARPDWQEEPLPGCRGLDSDAHLLALRRDLTARLRDPAVAQELASTYGTRAYKVVELIRTRPQLGNRVAPAQPTIWAQILFAATEEHAQTLEDALVRRTGIFYGDPKRGTTIADRAAELMASPLGWSAEKIAAETRRYHEMVARSESWRQKPDVEASRGRTPVTHAGSDEPR